MESSQTFAIYDTGSGVISRIFSGDEDSAGEQCAPREAAAPCPEFALDTTHYVETATRVVKERQSANVRHEMDGLTVYFPHIPEGSLLSVEWGEFEADGDGNDSIEFDRPGVYMVSIKPPAKFLEEYIEVVVHG